MKSVHHLLLCVAVCVLATSVLPAQEKASPRQIGEFVLTTEAPCLDVLHQGNTGTCWSFGTMSWLESEVMRLSGQKVDLSEMYVVRYSIQEKARRYVTAKGKANFSQGGLSHDVIAMVREHGIVPADAYTGLPQGARFHSHGEMFKLAKAILDKVVDPKSRRRGKQRWEGALMAMVDYYLGAPPTEVKTTTGTTSPVDYATKTLKLPLEDYVELMSYSTAPFHQNAELKVPDNWMHFDGYRNVPIDDFMRGFDHALEKGYTIAVDMDVSERGFNMRSGVARLPEKLEEPGAVTQEVRDEMFKAGKTTDDHLMHVLGIAKDEKGGKYYYTKNSWGTKSGPYGGYLFISENFMRAKLLAFMVHKEALPKVKGTN